MSVNPLTTPLNIPATQYNIVSISLSFDASPATPITITIALLDANGNTLKNQVLVLPLSALGLPAFVTLASIQSALISYLKSLGVIN